jgi:hypothetical protein
LTQDKNSAGQQRGLDGGRITMCHAVEHGLVALQQSYDPRIAATRILETQVQVDIRPADRHYHRAGPENEQDHMCKGIFSK